MFLSVCAYVTCQSGGRLGCGGGWGRGWEAECRQLAWQPAALAACWSRVECAGRKRNAT